MIHLDGDIMPDVMPDFMDSFPDFTQKTPVGMLARMVHEHEMKKKEHLRQQGTLKHLLV